MPTPPPPSASATGAPFAAVLELLGVPAAHTDASAVDLARRLVEIAEILARNEEIAAEPAPVEEPWLANMTGIDDEQIAQHYVTLARWRSARLCVSVLRLSDTTRQAVAREGMAGDFWQLAAQAALSLDAALSLLVSISTGDDPAIAEFLDTATARLASAGQRATYIRATAKLPMFQSSEPKRTAPEPAAAVPSPQPGPPYEIRTATQADKEPMKEILSRRQAWAAGLSGAGPIPCDAHALIRVPQPGRQVLVLSEDHRVLGFMVLVRHESPGEGWSSDELHENTVHMTRVFTDPAGGYRLSSLMDTWAADYVARTEPGVQWIRCTVRHPRLAALLERAGWTQVRVIEDAVLRTTYLMQRAPRITPSLGAYVDSAVPSTSPEDAPRTSQES